MTVQVNVSGVGLDARRQAVVLLRPDDELFGPRRVLPIWIGPQEAASISLAIGDTPSPRPLTHDLMVELAETLGATFGGVAVTRVEEGTFYAEVTLHTAAGTRVFDSRPSDAIALAVRTGAPITVADEVFEEAAVIDDLDDDSEDVDAGPVTEDEVQEFRRLLDEIGPDDFRG